MLDEFELILQENSRTKVFALKDTSSATILALICGLSIGSRDIEEFRIRPVSRIIDALS